MQDYELDAWLGETEASEEQREQLQAVAAEIRERYPEDDLEDARRDALNGAAQVILGDDTLEDLAGLWRQAVEAEREAKILLDGAIIAAHQAGGTEKGIAARAGFGANRTTIRRALGK